MTDPKKHECSQCRPRAPGERERIDANSFRTICPVRSAHVFEVLRERPEDRPTQPELPEDEDRAPSRRMLMAVRCENCHHNHDVSKAMAWHISEAFARLDEAIDAGGALADNPERWGPLAAFSDEELLAARKVVDAFLESERRSP